jgi:flagellar biosynthetic protein FlhB
MADHSQKTEQPTQRRIQKAREEGNFPVSRELISYAQFGTAALLLFYGAGQWWSGVEQFFRSEFAAAFRTGSFGAADLEHHAVQAAWTVVLPLAGALLLLTGASVAVQLLLNRGGLATKKLVPDWNRLNPIQKVTGLFKQNRVAFLQAVALLPLVAAGLAYELKRQWPILERSLFSEFRLAVNTDISVVKTLIWHGLFVLGVFAFLDAAWQFRTYAQELRMSKQEIRDEYKEQDGDPRLKQRLRQMQRDLLRRKMMNEVPTATAVIVNPTHYAVAIRYRIDSSAAPTVVAKGKNYLAARIRQKATEHDIPIVENPPLARALYKSVPVGQEIPPQLFRAVAEILAYIYRLMNGRLPGS